MKDVWGHSGSMDQSLSELEIRHRTLAREAAVEGIVLLKNEGVLPLSTASAIALLGSGAEKTIKGGIGSGDVNNRENISIYQGMKEAGVTITSEDWLEDYEERYKNARNVWKEKILEDLMHTQATLLFFRKDGLLQQRISQMQKQLCMCSAVFPERVKTAAG